MEAWACLSIIELGLSVPQIDTDVDLETIRRYPIHVINRDLPSELHLMEHLMCDYGVIRLTQSCHMTHDKHKYTRIRTHAGILVKMRLVVTPVWTVLVKDLIC